jgi:hypothetical protein
MPATLAGDRLFFIFSGHRANNHSSLQGELTGKQVLINHG